MIDITKSIQSLDTSDISDNLLHYKYNVSHLLSLIDKDIEKDDPLYISSYRSFEGEVYENFLYEKLLRYAQENDFIDKFVLKGFHQNKKKSNPNTLSISEKQQIVYRTKSREISEFDALFTTIDNELYFVEMTLVKSVLKLRKRLRKKKALLEILFPNYTIKALIILNDGAVGANQFPEYCTVWFTSEFSAKDVLSYILQKEKRKILPKNIIQSPKMIEAQNLPVYKFRYYNTMTWITKKLRANKKFLIDKYFLISPNIQRYHNLYNKFYIGFCSIETFQKFLQFDGKRYDASQRVIVAIEKKHSNEIVLTYYIQTSRKDLLLFSFNESNELVSEKKDPYGITVTEVFHINRFMDEKYQLSFKNLKTIEKFLKKLVVQ